MLWKAIIFAFVVNFEVQIFLTLILKQNPLSAIYFVFKNKQNKSNIWFILFAGVSYFKEKVTKIRKMFLNLINRKREKIMALNMKFSNHSTLGCTIKLEIPYLFIH